MKFKILNYAKAGADHAQITLGGVGELGEGEASSEFAKNMAAASNITIHVKTAFAKTLKIDGTYELTLKELHEKAPVPAEKAK